MVKLGKITRASNIATTYALTTTVTKQSVGSPSRSHGEAWKNSLEFMVSKISLNTLTIHILCSETGQLCYEPYTTLSES